MNAKKKRQLENQLLTMGLARLEDPELIGQLAQMVSDFPGGKHDFLCDLLNECDADKRYEMYQAIAPKLRFKALSFEQYECQIAEKAGRLVSQGRMRVEGQAPKPIEIGGHKYAAVSRHAAGAQAVVTVTCYYCPTNKRFLADTPVSAMLEARKAGWVRDPGLNKEVCPECAATKFMVREVHPVNTLRIPQNRIPMIDRRRVN